MGENNNDAIPEEICAIKEAEGIGEDDYIYYTMLDKYEDLRKEMVREMEDGETYVAHVGLIPLLDEGIEILKKLLSNELRGDIDTMDLQRQLESNDLKVAKLYIQHGQEQYASLLHANKQNSVRPENLIIPVGWDSGSNLQ